MVTEYKTPDKKDTDLMFAVYQDKKRQTRDISMMTFVKAFGKTLDRMNRGNREE